MRALALQICGLLVASSAVAQPALVCDPASALSDAAFVECARQAAEKYQDRSRAIADGYRPIGRDFPAMGEHWIRIALVFDSVIDPARPEVLNYVDVNGQPTLVGLGYALPLLAGEQAPAAPAGRDAWHDHFRTIEDETVLPHLEPGHAHGAARLAMLHAWIWAPNPEGLFAADNWALPYVRLGLTTPDRPNRAASQALSLLTGGTDFFQRRMTAEHGLSPAAAARVGQILETARARVDAVVRDRMADTLAAPELGALAAVWGDVERAAAIAARAATPP